MDTNMIEKIRKLLALAADPSCEGAEGENAARMAARLMTKYQIDESMLEGSSGKIKCGFAYARHMNKGKTDAPAYCGVVAIGVGEYLGCVVSLVNVKESGAEEYVQKFKFGGEVTDVRFAVWLCETLCANAMREFIAATTTERKDVWLRGWAAAVQRRLYHMAEVRKTEETAIKAESSTALVVLDSKVALVKEKFGDTEKCPSKGKSGIDGYLAGQKTVIPTGALANASNSGLLS